MTTLGGIVLTLAIIMFVGILTVALIARMLYKRIRRSRALTGAVLRTRTRLSRGPQHEVLHLRLRLREALDSGEAAVDLALRSAGPRGELARLFRRIQSEGSTLDSQLQLMASESDSAVLRAGIPDAGRRVDEVAGLVRRLRSAVAGGLGDLSDDTLTSLRSEVDHEVAALGAGVQELRTLNGYDGMPGSRRQLSMDRLIRGNKS